MSRPVSFPAVAGAAYACVVVQAVHPITPESGAVFCPFRLVTGLPCPGCGMGHALVFALHGDFAGSLHSHPLGMPLLLLWTAWLGWGLVNSARGREFSDGFIPVLRRPAVSWAALAVVLAVYAVRVASV
jgi:uncharacterized protein DUF2752